MRVPCVPALKTAFVVAACNLTKETASPHRTTRASSDDGSALPVPRMALTIPRGRVLVSGGEYTQEQLTSPPHPLPCYFFCAGVCIAVTGKPRAASPLHCRTVRVTICYLYLCIVHGLAGTARASRHLPCLASVLVNRSAGRAELAQGPRNIGELFLKEGLGRAVIFFLLGRRRGKHGRAMVATAGGERSGVLHG